MGKIWKIPNHKETWPKDDASRKYLKRALNRQATDPFLARTAGKLMFFFSKAKDGIGNQR